jgi:transcriptional regulator with XRE-family HTH domain
MPRFRITDLDRSFEDDRWTYFGPWLRSRRMIARLTQDEAAQAAGVSRRQWIRYEQGSKMLRKKIKRVAAAINVPEQRMLDRAGYKVSRRRNDVNGHLGKIKDHLYAGKDDVAIVDLMKLRDRMLGHRKGYRPLGVGTDGFEFAKLVVSIDQLSAEFFNLLLDVMQESQEEKLNDEIMHPRDRNRFRDRCIEALQSNRFRIHTFQTDPSIYYTIS